MEAVLNAEDFSPISVMLEALKPIELDYFKKWIPLFLNMENTEIHHSSFFLTEFLDIRFASFYLLPQSSGRHDRPVPPCGWAVTLCKVVHLRRKVA